MPENNKSVLDVVREREAATLKKRKRESGHDAGDEELVDGMADSGRKKKVKKADVDGDAAEAKRREKADRRKEKRARKKEKVERKKAKVDAKKARKQDQDLDEAQAERHVEQFQNGGGSEAEAIGDTADLAKFQLSNLEDSDDEIDFEMVDEDEVASHHSSAPTTPLLDSPAFDLATDHSEGSSSSSIIPPSTNSHNALPSTSSTSQPQPSKPILATTPPATTSEDIDPEGAMSPKVQIPKIDHAILESRLRRRIDEMRDARKADENNKNRNAMIEARKAKETRKKAARKEQWQKEREEEAKRQEAMLRGSGSPLVGDVFSPRETPRPQSQNNSFAFSRLAFDDGMATDASMTGLQQPGRKKGPSDPKTALKAAQNKQSRLAGYDSAKQNDILEKDSWLNAKKRAQGEKGQRDPSLLKKLMKNREKAKSKSGEQWKERQEGIVKGREMKQKKREINLQKRKDEKGGKGKKKGVGKPGGGKGGKAGAKKGKRPGFEGRFKA